MYNFELSNDENIQLICDDVFVSPEDKKCTVIITNKRLLILDYPSKLYNSTEDLRAIGRINTVKMKEIIFETDIDNIKDIERTNKYDRFILCNNNYIELENRNLSAYFKNLNK